MEFQWYYILVILGFGFLIYKGRKQVKKQIIKIKYTTQFIFYTDRRKIVLKLINELRIIDGVTILKAGKKEDDTANNRCDEIIEEYKKTQKISHEGFADDATNLIKKGAKKVGENIAFGYATVKGVMKSWSKSIGHLKNMLNPKYDTIGLSIKMYKKRLFWVQILVDSDGKN